MEGSKDLWNQAKCERSWLEGLKVLARGLKGSVRPAGRSERQALGVNGKPKGVILRQARSSQLEGLRG